MTGGSSGGSGGAAAAGLAAITRGSDTNGSIRVPSSLCGVWGIKPTFSLALSYDALQGPDALDPGCHALRIQPVHAQVNRGVQGLRIGVLGGYFHDHATPPAREVLLQAAQALGASDTVEWPDAAMARAAAFITTASAGGSLHLADLAVFGAVLLAALGYAEGGQLSKAMGGQQVISWALLLSVPLVLPVVLWQSWGEWDAMLRAGLHAWAGFAYVSVFSMFIGFFFWYRGMALGGVARVGQVHRRQRERQLLVDQRLRHAGGGDQVLGQHGDQVGVGHDPAGREEL
eukprot:gene35336-39974_t